MACVCILSIRVVATTGLIPMGVVDHRASARHCHLVVTGIIRTAQGGCLLWDACRVTPLTHGDHGGGLDRDIDSQLPTP